MALIEWNDSLSVNVAEIDRQHRKLIDMINALNDAMRQGKGKEALSDIVGGLAGYAASHFKTEETCFDRFGYPDADSHKQEHAAFTQKVAEFKTQFDAGQIGLSMEVMKFLSNWLQAHIKTVDKRYGPFFNENGMA